MKMDNLDNQKQYDSAVDLGYILDQLGLSIGSSLTLRVQEANADEFEVCDDCGEVGLSYCNCNYEDDYEDCSCSACTGEDQDKEAVVEETTTKDK